MNKGRLCTIMSSYDNARVKQLVSGTSTGVVWIGMTQNGWYDGSPTFYDNWASGEKYSSWFSEGVVMRLDGEWYKESDSQSYPACCVLRSCPDSYYLTTSQFTLQCLLYTVCDPTTEAEITAPTLTSDRVCQRKLLE